MCAHKWRKAQSRTDNLHRPFLPCPIDSSACTLLCGRLEKRLPLARQKTRRTSEFPQHPQLGLGMKAQILPRTQAALGVMFGFQQIPCENPVARNAHREAKVNIAV